MPATASIKPNHRAIKKYYETLGRIHAQGVDHELATRPAFQNLLADLAKSKNWDLITELGAKHAGNYHHSSGAAHIPGTQTLEAASLVILKHFSVHFHWRQGHGPRVRH